MAELLIKVRLKPSLLFYCCLLFLSIGCKRNSERKGQVLLAEQKIESGLLVTKLGDPRTNDTPIPINEQPTDAIITPFEPVILKTDPLILNIPDNRTLTDTSVKVQVKASVEKSLPNQEGFPMPNTLKVLEKRVPLVQKQPFKAGPFQTRENAVGNIQYLGLEEGLSSYYATEMLFDRRGHLWFAGENSTLNRYDGRMLTYFNLPEGFIKQNHWIKALLEDNNGDIWIGGGGGLARFDGHQITYYSNAGTEHPWFVTHLAKDSQGRTWIGTRKSGLICYDGNDFLHYGYQHGVDPQFPIWSIFEDKKGKIWIGSDGGGLSRFEFDGKGSLKTVLKYRMQNGFIHDNVRDIIQDQYDNIWIATRGGVSRFDGKTFMNISTTEGLCGNIVNCLFETSKGDLLIGNNNCALNWFDGKYVSNFSEDSGTNSVHAYEVTDDGAGNIWVGTGEGIHRYGAVQFRHFKFEIEGTFSEPRVIQEDPLGLLWFGTNGGAKDLDGLIKFDGQNFSQLSRVEGLPLQDGYLASGTKDKQGSLWLAGSAGDIFQIIGPDIFHAWLAANTQTKSRRYGIKTILQSTQNELWIATNRGIFKKKENKLSQLSLQGNSINTLIEDKKGKIWMGGPTSLASFFQDSITYYTTDNGLPHGDVRSLLVDQHGKLWAGTNGGISYFQNGKFKNFTREDGLVDDRVRSLIEDHQNRIWVGTQNGLSVMVPDESFSNYTIYSFDKQDGILQTDFNQNSVCLDSQNRLWWGKTKGAMMLDLNHFELPKLVPKIYLEHLEINQEFIDYRRLNDAVYAEIFPLSESLSNSFDSVVSFFNYPIGLKLPYQLNHLSFQFSGIDWASPQKLKYSFRLNGLDKGWSLPQEDPKIDYRNLPHGKFTLEVKAKGAAQVWSEAFKYHFEILPPWWYSWWAYTLYGIIGLLVLTGLFLYQRRRYQLQTRLQLQQERADRLREMDQFKSRFYTNITHEFRTPLTVIKGMSEEIGKVKVKNMIQRNTDRLLDMVNQLLDLSKLESRSLPINWVQTDIVPFLQYLTESCHSLAEKKKLNLAFFSKQDELVMDFDEIRIQQILINLLSNAIKFTPEYGSVKVIAAQVTKNDQDYLELTVKDTGKGIPANSLPHIFDRFYQIDNSATRRGEGSGIGLALVKELVHLFGGQIEVKSEAGKGTSFMLYFPIHRQAAKKERLDLNTLASATLTVGSFDTPQTTALPAVDEEKPQVLIIEDNADVAEYIVSCLQHNYSLQTARNGRDGLEKALEHIPDVILCDVMMPEMDGFEVCRRLKADRRSSHIPIVLLTAKATQEDKLTGLIQGADAYLTKPFDKEELLVRLRNLSIQSLRLRERINEPEKEQQQLTEQQQREADFIQEVNQVIESNMSHELFDTNFLCRAVLMSRTQLHRKLKALTGQSTAQYIRMARLQEAKRLLETTDLPIGEIAEQVGYKDFSHFSRSFAKAFNSSPSGIRK